MSFFYKINNVLEKTLGIRIARIKKSSTTNIKLSRPLFVEFTGTSGVGKSTIYIPMINQIRNGVDLQQFLSRNNLKDFEISNLLDSDPVYQALAKLKIEASPQTLYTYTDELRLLRNYEWYIKSDAIARHLNKHSLVYTDEGLIHYFGNEIKRLMDEESLKEELEKTLQNRLIVYCYARPEVIAKRILNRKEKSGKLVPQHKVDSLNELIDLMNNDLIKRQNIMESLQNQGIPVLYLNTEDSNEENIAKTIQFINEYL